MRKIKLAMLLPSKTNPRKAFGQSALDELAASIREKGVLQPIVVRPRGKKFEIVIGERRFRAAKLAGLEEIPAIVEAKLDDVGAVEMQTIENLQREDLDALEEADGYQRLIDLGGYDVAKVASVIGKSASYVYQRLKLAALVPAARKALAAGEITAGHAILIARLPAGDQQTAINWLEPDPENGSIASVRVLRDWIFRELHKNLSAAPFRKNDAELVPDAGACKICPKRSRNQPELYPDARKADLCTDPVCFEKKLDAFLELRRVELKEQGRDFIEISEDYQRKGAAYIHDCQIIGDKRKHCDRAVTGLVIDGSERGKILTVCRRGPCKTHFPYLVRDDAGDTSWKARQAKEDLARRRRLETRTRIFQEVRTRLRAPTRDDRELALRRFYDRLQNEDQKRFLHAAGLAPVKVKRYGYDHLDTEKPFAELAAAASSAELDRLFVQLAVVADVNAYIEKTDLLALAKRLEIDVDGIRKAVTAYLRPKRKAKKKKRTKSRKAKA